MGDNTLKKKNRKIENDHYVYILIVGCFTILSVVLIYMKITKQRGKWSKNLNSKNVYMYKKTFQDSKDSRGELECRKFLETVFQLPFSKARPDFLKNPITGNNLEIDCFNSDLKLGVEYNGEQHYTFNTFFHKNSEASTNQKYRDELKRRMCKDNGINLIEVPYTIKLNDIGSFLNLRLKQLGYLN